jgi:hypothetical protein
MRASIKTTEIAPKENILSILDMNKATMSELHILAIYDNNIIKLYQII